MEMLFMSGLKKCLDRGWLLIAVLMSACAAPATTPDSSSISFESSADVAGLRIVQHAMGETEVACTSQRIVTLGQDATDAVLALGVTPIGAVDPWGGRWYAYLGDRMANVVSLGMETEPNLETIVSLRPDLILGSQLRHEAIYEQLRQIAPTIFAETIGRTWKENFQLYAQALCRETEGERIIAAWNDRIADFQAQMGERLKTEVSLIRFRADEVRIYTTGFPGSVLREAGLSRPESQQVDDWETAPQVLVLNKEQIPMMDGDILFYMVSNWGDDQGSQIMEEWTGHPLWKTLKAVQNNAVHPVNEEHWNLGGGVLAANRMLDDLYHFFLPEAQSSTAQSSETGGDAIFPVVIEHKFGRIAIPAPPERVMTLGCYVAKAMRKSGVTGEVLVQLLESRLDAFVLRAGFVNTIYAARQFVSHGHVRVDGRPVNLPGYQLKPGQIVTVKEKVNACRWCRRA